MENIAQKSKQVGALAKMQMKKMLDAMRSSETMVRNIIIVIIIIIIIGVSLYVSGKMSYEKNKCNDLSTIYNDMGKVASINPLSDDLKDYKF